MSSRLSHIDFLRFIASAAVVYQHVVEASNLDWLKPTLGFAPGVFGVVLFFLVSGLVIPFSFPEGGAWHEFAIKRVFRIFPNYWFTIALIAGFSALGLNEFTRVTQHLSLWGWVANLLLVQEYSGQMELLGVAWTLPLEFAWYSLFLISVLVAQRDRAADLSVLFSLMICLAAAVSMIFELRLPFGRIGMVNAALFGYALYGLRAGAIGSRKFRMAAAVFLLSTVFSEWVSFGYFKHPNITLFNGMSGWLTATAVFLSVALVPAVRESRFVNGWIFAQAGAISYSIYLIHPIIIGLHMQILGRSWMWLVVPVCTLLIAMVTFRWVERSGIALGRLIIRSLAGVGSTRGNGVGTRAGVGTDRVPGVSLGQSV